MAFQIKFQSLQQKHLRDKFLISISLTIVVMWNNNLHSIDELFAYP